MVTQTTYLDHNSVSFTGHAGAIRVGYRTAAEFTAWKLTPEDGGRSFYLIAALTGVDEFWLQRGPYILELPIPHRQGRWRWRDVEVYVSRDTIEVRGGGFPQEL